MKGWLFHTTVAWFLSTPAHSFRRWYRDYYVFDHIEKFECETGRTALCVKRCNESPNCKIPSGEPSLYDIRQWRGCLKDVGSKCEFNFTLFLSYPVKSVTPYQATTPKPNSSPIPDPFSPQDTISVIQGIGTVEPGAFKAAPLPFTKAIRFSNPNSRSFDNLEPFGLDCDKATFVLQQGGKTSGPLLPKFIESRKFLVLIDRTVQSPTVVESTPPVKLKVLEPNLRHCLFSSSGKPPLLVFWLMEKAQIVTGYDRSVSLIKIDERDDFVMGRHPEEL